jgi:hypothetical protein
MALGDALYGGEGFVAKMRFLYCLLGGGSILLGCGLYAFWWNHPYPQAGTVKYGAVKEKRREVIIRLEEICGCGPQI